MGCRVFLVNPFETPDLGHRLQTHKCFVSPGVGDMHSHTLLWPLQLGMWTPMLWCGPSSWG